MVSSYYIQGFAQFYLSSAISYTLQLSSDITFLQLSNLLKTAVILEYTFLLPLLVFKVFYLRHYHFPRLFGIGGR